MLRMRLCVTLAAALLAAAVASAEEFAISTRTSTSRPRPAASVISTRFGLRRLAPLTMTAIRLTLGETKKGAMPVPGQRV